MRQRLINASMKKGLLQRATGVAARGFEVFVLDFRNVSFRPKFFIAENLIGLVEPMGASQSKI